MWSKSTFTLKIGRSLARDASMEPEQELDSWHRPWLNIWVRFADKQWHLAFKRRLGRYGWIPERDQEKGTAIGMRWSAPMTPLSGGIRLHFD